MSTSIRLTAHELKVLQTRFGSGTRGLRHLLDLYMASDPYMRSTKSVPSTPDADRGPQDSGPEGPDA